MSSIVTFHSSSDGVGRSMAVANIAALLTLTGRRVLAVDWSLHGDAQYRYFRHRNVKRQVGYGGGLGDLLRDDLRADRQKRRLHWEDYIAEVDLGGRYPLSVLARIARSETSESSLHRFNWERFYRDRHGGDFIELLGKEWRNQFDVVLIDSEMGYSDTAGVCAIQLPDVLVPVFAPSVQSAAMVNDFVRAAQEARQRLDVDRCRLLVFPIVSNADCVPFAGGVMEECANILTSCYFDWIARDTEVRRVLERTAIPCAPAIELSEELAVFRVGVRALEGLRTAYVLAATLIANGFESAEGILDGAVSLGARAAVSYAAARHRRSGSAR